MSKQLCQRHLFDAANDPYNFWRDENDNRIERNSVPCTCGNCPANEIRLGGLIDWAEKNYPEGYAIPTMTLCRSAQ